MKKVLSAILVATAITSVSFFIYRTIVANQEYIDGNSAKLKIIPKKRPQDLPIDLPENTIIPKKRTQNLPIDLPENTNECNADVPENPNKFVPTPECYQEFLNSLSWGGGKTVKFSNLEECRNIEYWGSIIWMDNDPPSANAYTCARGYATITDPRGTQVCKVDFYPKDINGELGRTINGTAPGIYTMHGASTHRVDSDCVWKS